ncbi:MAG: SPFH domain-containing protein [Pirellulaceae bacterium]
MLGFLSYSMWSISPWAIGGGVLVLAVAVTTWLSVRFIPNDCVGVVEKLWSASGSVTNGRIIAIDGEAGFAAELLRGGVHFGYWRWQYRVHTTPLVTIPQGKIGYVYARDGMPLPAGQTLGSVVPCNHFQDALAFLDGDGKSTRRGQRGRQLAILREGVYAVNPALFLVITENAVFNLVKLLTNQERATIVDWQKELTAVNGFNPVVIGRPIMALDPLHPETEQTVDSIGIVTVHDGPSLMPGEIIAPMVGAEPGLAHYHNNFQDPQAFLDGGGRRGRQYLALTDGTYFINRWFATIELIPKTVVPIGYVGVVVSYYGKTGCDLSGESFRHGERVTEGERGVWERPFGPGKYAFNTYAGQISLVPTTNFVLHWITGKTESHRYDESLRSIDLVTRDAFEPRLPLSVVVHIDYQRAPNVIQRFGDVKRLITQTLDPLLSSYFRDIAHRKAMLELLHDRDVIQAEARAELRRRFHEFDIECVDVLIGKPDPAEGDTKIETLLEQLRLRQLSIEQLETYERQKTSTEKLRALNEVQAQADMQTSLTNARVKAQIAESEGEADLARARKQAEKQVVMADAQLQQARRQAEQTLVLAEANSKQAVLQGTGEGQRILQAGLAEAVVLQRKVDSYGDPRLYSLTQVGAMLSKSHQPLVPQQLFVGASGNSDGAASAGLLGTLLTMVVAEKSGFQLSNGHDRGELQRLAATFTEQALTQLAAGKTQERES